MSETSSSKKPSQTKSRGLTRRTAVKLAAGAVGVAAFARAIAPVRAFTSEVDRDEFLQQHYRELSDDDKRAVLARLEAWTKREYGADVDIDDPPPRDGTKFGYALNLTTCLGCRQCAEACHRENNHDRRSHNSYIRVFEVDDGTLDLARGTTRYDHPVPQDDKFYMPVQCHHCANPPCVDVCPVKATWKEPDGIVAIDYNWCIGCRYCEAACPYHARRFNWARPEIPPDEVNPDQAYLSNRIRMKGVMEKCTFCLHRTREGRLPACLEACPAGARVFGNLLDPESDIRWVLANKRVLVLKEDYGTVPSFFYYFGD
ncbi:MAG: 4Fe-4S dicluster domain-containing protein [Deltaproteobacteria bacterium]|jgi:molybdopterin-containing oxidoreductase family iron-sulfur binding subunit|nr:4Fe-4S dicluster domain-containing protein [Deltaproteobacteria bacterium]MBW2536639.1 4Fe-4S dicluster domain-containing protein [Deltaproteobacteria bacterium]